MAEVRGGIEEEKRELIWKIKNFARIVEDNSLINSQCFHFRAGDTVGLPTKWKVFLRTSDREHIRGNVGIFLKLAEKPEPPQTKIFAKVSFSVESGNVAVPSYEKATQNMGHLYFVTGFGTHSFFAKRDVAGILEEDGTLVIRVKFNIYSSPTTGKVSPKLPVSEMLEKFNKDSSTRAWRDLKGLLQLPVAYSEVKIISKDGRQFTAKKEVLAARSPVFEAMLVRCDMKEKAEEEVKLPDISGPTVDVLLHYLYTGELLPEWREGDVLVELTNAVAKYQLIGLLQFLDGALGQVCVSGNILDLLSLADKLELRKAEEELMEFLRREGVASKEKLLEIVDAQAQSVPKDE